MYQNAQNTQNEPDPTETEPTFEGRIQETAPETVPESQPESAQNDLVHMHLKFGNPSLINTGPRDQKIWATYDDRVVMEDGIGKEVQL